MSLYKPVNVNTQSVDLSNVADKTTQGTINTNVSTTKSVVDTIDTNVNSIKTTVGTVNTNTASTKTTVDTINTNVNSVKSTVGTVNTNVSSIKSTVSTINTNIDNIKSNVSGSYYYSHKSTGKTVTLTTVKASTSESVNIPDTYFIPKYSGTVTLNLVTTLTTNIGLYIFSNSRDDRIEYSTGAGSRSITLPVTSGVVYSINGTIAAANTDANVSVTLTYGLVSNTSEFALIS